MDFESLRAVNPEIVAWLTIEGTNIDYPVARPDGMSLSRTAELVCGKNGNFLFVASSVPGEANKAGPIVPRFGNKPENHVS